jgi:hypothetical protein
MWTTSAQVLDSMGNPVLLAEDQRFLDLCVDAANSAVSMWRPDLDPAAPIEPHIALGTAMVATAWFQRRSGDVAAFAEFGGPPPAIGRDIEQMLQINRAAKPVIA